MLTQFVTLDIHLQDSPIQLQRAIATALQTHGEPLRWAITQVDLNRQVAHVEAVVTVDQPALSGIAPVETV